MRCFCVGTRIGLRLNLNDSQIETDPGKIAKKHRGGEEPSMSEKGRNFL